jgi:predicted Fe-S protein YdhL (DUF1289 family)
MTSRRPRRRARPERQWDNTVPSPCVAVCTYGGDNLCEGCMRNADEIREWMIMSREQKLTVLENIEQRKDALFGE